jgi:hypothetical protein
MVDNLEIKPPGPLPSGIRNIRPKLLNDTKKIIIAQSPGRVNGYMASLMENKFTVGFPEGIL